MKEEKKVYYKIVHENDHSIELRIIKNGDLNYHDYSKEGTVFSVLGALDELRRYAKSFNGVVVEVTEQRRYLTE